MLRTGLRSLWRASGEPALGTRRKHREARSLLGTIKPAASTIKRMLRPNVSLLLTGQSAGRDSPLFPSRNGNICFFTCSHRFALTWSQEGKMCEHAGHTQRLGNSARDRDTRAGSTPRSTYLPLPCFTTEAHRCSAPSPAGGDVERQYPRDSHTTVEGRCNEEPALSERSGQILEVGRRGTL